MPEEYAGIKFEAELAEGARDAADAVELIKWCRAFCRMGIATPGGEVAGNISVRTKRGFLITPSGRDFSEIGKDQLVEVVGVNEETHKVMAVGIVNPSSEAFLHAGIYAERGDVNAILHGHSGIVTAHAEELGIPETAEEQPYGTIALRDEVHKILDRHFLLQMKGHGFIAMGASLQEAGERAEALCRKAMEKFK